MSKFDESGVLPNMTPRGHAASHPSKRLGTPCVALCALLIAGCAAIPASEPVPSEAAPSEAVGGHPTGPDQSDATEQALPNVEFTTELLYDILLGEIAMQRGEFDAAAEAMMRAALTSGDYRVAERASWMALHAKDYATALKAAELWAELQPDEPKPLETIARILVADNRVDEAEARLSELVKRGEPRVGTVYRRIANLLAQQKEPAEGTLALMDRLIQLHPEDPEAYFARAYVADRVGESESVTQSLERALSLRPGWEEAALALLSHHAELKQSEQASVFSEKFLEEYPGSSRFRLQYARYLVDQGKQEQALNQFQTLSERDPKNADAAFATGLLNVQLDRYQDAEKYLQKNLGLRPNNDQARLYLGQIAWEQKQFDKAESWYRQIKNDNFYFEAQVLLGGVIAKLHGVDRAIDHLDDLNPRNEDEQVRVVLSKEQVLRTAKELNRAKAVLDAALDELPEQTDLLYARGLVAAQLDLITLHEQDMRKLLAKDPQNAHALNALGYTLADQTQRYQEAFALIEQALRLRPDDPFIMDSMGWVQYRLGNHDLAIEYLERALEKRQDAEIAAHLAEVLWAIGNKDRAEKILKRALKKSPDNDVLLSTIEKLKQ